MLREILPIGSFDRDLEGEVAETLAYYDAPGAAVALRTQDGGLYASGVGVKTLGTRQPVTASTAFNVGSTSKAFTATAAAILVERGVLSWDDPVRRWIPDFQTYDASESDRVTLRDLSGNRTGFPRNGVLEFGTELAIGADEAVRRLRYAEPVAPLRSRFTYSNLSHTTLALCIQAASRMRYEAFLKREIFAPLGMTNAGAGAGAREEVADHAGWHCAREGRTVALTPVFTDVHRGSAGVVLSASDSARWLDFNLRDGAPLICERRLEELFEPQIAVDGRDHAIWIAPSDAQDVAYGLGWGLSVQNGVRVARHSGSDFGINAHVALSREAGCGVAVSIGKDCKASIEISYVLFDKLMGWARHDWRAAASDKRLADTNATFQQSKRRPSGAPPAHPLEAYAGAFANQREGPVHIRLSDKGLSAAFKDAPIFDAHLEPLGGDSFLLSPFYEGLVSDAVGARFETTFLMRDHRCEGMEIRGIGRFERVA